ncbi:SRPBCC family protein [Natronomonas sp. F2-12]|jgi:hypothetical protein|uniref:SRPBCC family protein n=1 Tax=Natronomonas aquatica TaxID=2841590 RepID=A0A9R1CST4_9EURY|nr:SRPBCC family protein [Natronomonas aquatica]MCQ4332971.1 SRPBCC family protein [Natronomonas aquatica]
MNSVTVSRTTDASADDIREAIDRVGPFMEASGFDEVTVDGDTVRVANQVGFATIELTLALVEDSEAALAYEQRDGIFRKMRTRYVVAPADGGTEVTAMTEFELDVAVVGDVLDATVIERQRRAELTAQLEWLEEVCGE